MHGILEFLHGKKATIATAINLIAVYAQAKGFIDMDTTKLVVELTLLFAFGADYQTKKLLGTHRK